MSGEGKGRFVKGQSGNPNGRPRARRPHVSAFDIIFDKTLTVTQDGKVRELSVDEALQLKTYQAALGGSRMAIRKVLKMIEKRERALAEKHRTPARKPITVKSHHSSDNADEALRILGIAEPEPGFERRIKVHAWATQAALSRPGRRRFTDKEVGDIKFFTFDSDTLRWPRGRVS